MNFSTTTGELHLDSEKKSNVFSFIFNTLTIIQVMTTKACYINRYFLCFLWSEFFIDKFTSP